MAAAAIFAAITGAHLPFPVEYQDDRHPGLVLVQPALSVLTFPIPAHGEVEWIPRSSYNPQ
jgi:hypothetical protein